MIGNYNSTSIQQGQAGASTTGFGKTFPGGSYNYSYNSDYCELFAGSFDPINGDYRPGTGTVLSYATWSAAYPSAAKNTIYGWNGWDFWSDQGDGNFILHQGNGWNVGSKAPKTTFLLVSATPNSTYTVINHGSLIIQYWA